jgi:hypothetical protein
VANKTKRPSKKRREKKVADHAPWTIWRGKLVPSAGRPDKVLSIFSVIAEKLPFASLPDVERDMKDRGIKRTGIYLAHDSMGAVRYAGLGSIFTRLRTRKNARPLELHYFSFYVLPHKKHQRELETLLIRSIGLMLTFNDRKKPPTIETGNIRDYEGGTVFYERQRKKGRKART